MTCIDYKDTITLITTTVDNYGAEVVESEYEVPAIVEMATGYIHTDNQAAITSDAIAFLDPSNSDLIANFYRLEEMLVIANLFGASEAQSWFKIESVVIARDTLLCNQIDNVQITLKKVRPIGGIS